MRKEIHSLKKKLPAKGYAAVVLVKAGNDVSINQIKNFFNGRPVNAKASEKIVKAAVSAIKERERKEKTLRRLMASV